MATDNNIKHFTAADIEKYHQGLLSNKERHDLEKAAMDDPFLADALEGYAVAGVNAGNDIVELKKRLAERTTGAKVIAMNAAPQRSFRILRAAILVAFVAGASLLIYQFGFNKKGTEIAQAKPAKKEEVKLFDSTKGSSTNQPVVTTKEAAESKPGNTSNDFTTKSTTAPVTDDKVASGSGQKGQIDETPDVTEKKGVDEIAINKPAAPQPVVTTTAKDAEEKADSYKITDNTVAKNEAAKEREMAAKKFKTESRQETNNNSVKDKATEQNNGFTAQNRRANEQNLYRDRASNLFRGRVIDADNNGVPFANVTNVQDNNAGTYTDANGNFNLTYPDSILTVQVRSIGFENTNIQLRNNLPTNQVVMQEDRKNLSQVVVSNQKPGIASRSRDATMKLEEPEPADGWSNYDTYVANNLEVPEDLKNKQTGVGAVELSFEVNKNGEPTNIKVEKSLCPKCDEEAKRLIKEGPKWKRSAAKKGRTKVTIAF
jgi:CarboxypepD_reg-like domain/Gram-negative bacterial TonB protein C-terminal